MFLPLYCNYPSWIHPEIFPGIPVLGLLRWYGLMYIFAFGTAFFVLKKEMQEGALDSKNYKATEDDIFGFIATGIVFLLIGARIFSTLVYDTSGMYRERPWLIFWPFDTVTHKFTGLAGMSYHGGLIGGLIGTIVWCKRHKKNTLQWMDAIAAAIPAGYTFGRLGNFLNGELYGRITTMPWGIVFPQAEKFSASLKWVQEFAAKIGMEISSATVNLPRHPSQLYEAFFEGVVLFGILHLIRKRKIWDGMISSAYVFAYGAFRFVIEYFREPDADLGFRIGKDTASPVYMNASLLNFSTGQILCFLMMLSSLVFAAVSYCYAKKRSKENTL